MMMGLARFMWKFDSIVIDGLVNGTGWLTVKWADVKMWFDKWIVDGAVNGAGWIVTTIGTELRYLQSGSVQFYTLFALLMAVVLLMMKYFGRNLESGVSWSTVLAVFAAGTIIMLVLGKVFSRTEVPAENAKQEE